jgi:hypothetical protein
MDKEITFFSNVPVIVYLGRLAHYPNPLPNDFENIGQFLSLLQIQNQQEITTLLRPFSLTGLP